LDIRALFGGSGACFFVIRKSQNSISIREGTMKIQAFHKPNSKSGINDIIHLLQFQ
jgi:hypothetical protein